MVAGGGKGGAMLQCLTTREKKKEGAKPPFYLQRMRETQKNQKEGEGKAKPYSQSTGGHSKNTGGIGNVRVTQNGSPSVPEKECLGGTRKGGTHVEK